MADILRKELRSYSEWVSHHWPAGLSQVDESNESATLCSSLVEMAMQSAFPKGPGVPDLAPGAHTRFQPLDMIAALKSAFQCWKTGLANVGELIQPVNQFRAVAEYRILSLKSITKLYISSDAICTCAQAMHLDWEIWKATYSLWTREGLQDDLHRLWSKFRWQIESATTENFQVLHENRHQFQQSTQGALIDPCTSYLRKTQAYMTESQLLGSLAWELQCGEARHWHEEPERYIGSHGDEEMQGTAIQLPEDRNRRQNLGRLALQSLDVEKPTQDELAEIISNTLRLLRQSCP